MLRCVDLGLTLSDLENYDMGFVTDMLTEKGNDAEEYPYKATQRDFDKFRGAN